MLSPATDPAPDDDDALADALADAWVEQAAHNPAICRQALRAAGLIQAPEPAPISQIAQQCQLSEGTIRNIVSMFRSRLAAEILRDPSAQPHLIHRARKLMSQL